MSRIGKEPVPIPSGVDVAIDGRTVTVKGPRATLTRELHPDIAVEVAEGSVVVTRPSDVREHRSLHGLTRSLIANMVQGVTEGYTKGLEIQGVGYRAAKSGTGLTLQLGFSHPVEVAAPDGISLDVPSATRIDVSGADKQLVGQVAANIRAIRKPEPYKGKGIRYVGEQIRRKSGKAAG
jgi:large subunit ribosomal protein L6